MDIIKNIKPLVAGSILVPEIFLIKLKTVVKIAKAANPDKIMFRSLNTGKKLPQYGSTS
ncbi:MAG: hypothetical protein ACFFCS_13890 [Candidatus Hodarchaeota archaeon]